MDKEISKMEKGGTTKINHGNNNITQKPEVYQQQ